MTRLLPVFLVLSLPACGGPNAPSSGLPAPTLSAPPDDAVASGRPVLTVNNVAGTPSTTRTYDFQVAESESQLTGSAEALFTAVTGVQEGGDGRTRFQIDRDVQSDKRYFWHARAVQSGAAGAWSATFRFRTESRANTPPVIQSIAAAAPRAEVSDEVAVSAIVQDQETNPANLVYEWTAPGGAFAGAGGSVRWTAPSVTAPTAFDLTLTVIERYTVAIAGGGVETRENRVTGKTTVHVNDSSREITALATTFIDDFLHSELSPEFCVRNFTNTCQGKQDELSDIRDNRRLFINDPARSSMGAGSIAFYDAAGTRRPVAPSQAAFADFRAPCRFAATSRITGVFGFATGTCQLTHVYENWQWRQCESHLLNAMSSSTLFSRLPF